MKSQSLHDFHWLYSGNIDLIGQYQNRAVLQFFVVNNTLKGVFGHLEPISVAGVQDINDCLGVIVVVMPEVPEFGLSSNVPDSKLEALVVDFFDIEADCRN